MKIVILLLVAYLLGSIPSGVWIGKLFFKKIYANLGWEYRNNQYISCLRETCRNYGIINGYLERNVSHFITLFVWFTRRESALLWGSSCFRAYLPYFANFKGGKAVATSAGMLLAYSPTFFIYSALIL